MTTETETAPEPGADGATIAPPPPPYDPGPETAETAIEPAQTQSAALVEFDDRQIEVIRNTICPDFDEFELDLFLAQSRRLQLDPMSKQIYGWKDRGKVITMVSIDGLRLVARRTGKYQGKRGPEWLTHDMQWVDVWIDPKVQPLAARVWVKHADDVEWTPGTAPWAEFAKLNNDGSAKFGPWSSMPAHMLAKVAEAMALRAAFPADLSGVYTDDEIDTAGKLAAADVGSDDRPSAGDAAALDVMAKFEALPDDAIAKLEGFWRDVYVPKVLNTTPDRVGPLIEGALFRFQPGSPHIEEWARLVDKAVAATSTPPPESVEDEKPGPDADGPSDAPPPVDEGITAGFPQFLDAERLVLNALHRLPNHSGTIAEIAAALGIDPAPSLRSTVVDLFNAAWIYRASPDPDSAYILDLDIFAESESPA